MSGDLVHVNRSELVQSVVPDVDLELWASSMAHAGNIARGLATTEFVPKSLRKGDPGATTAAVAAAVLTGKEVGLSPMAALRSIDIIEGTPALRTVALRALVFKAGHDIWVVESTSTRAIVTGVRRGSSHEQTSTWTMDRAKAAGLIGKPNWQRHPGAMLVARATAEVCRLIAPDVLLGLPYATEELVDGGIEEGPAEIEAPEPSAPRRTAQRRTRRAVTPPPAPQAPARSEPVEDEPPLDDEQPAAGAQAGAESGEESRFDPGPAPATPPEPDPPAEAMATTGQVRAVERALTRVQLTSAHRRLQAVRQIVGRPIDNLDQLYDAEAAVVIDELVRLEQRRREQEAEAAKVEHQGELIPEASGEDDRWDEYLGALDADQTGETP